MNEELEKLKSEISKVKGTAALAEEQGDVRRIYNYCVHLIARQDYSEYKLRQKLRSKPQNLPHMIDEAIEKIKAKGLLREESYRRLFIRKWMMKGEAEDKIRKRGAMEKLVFDTEEFEQVAKELGISDDDSIEKLVAKKLRSKTIPTEWQEKAKLRDKTLRFLISKGHGFSEARKAIDKFMGKGTTPDFDE
jgi:SOS response regulatory protein OraA/RecX